MIVQLTLSIAFLLTAGTAAGQLLEYDLWNGRDAHSHSLFITNPAAYPLLKRPALGGALLRKTTDVAIDSDIVGAGEATGDYDIAEEIGGAAGLLTFGEGIYLGGSYQQNSRVQRSKLSTTTAGTVKETYNTRLAAAQLGLAITEGLRIAAVFRYLWIDADIVGSFFMSERTQYDGQANGNGLGLLLGNEDNGWGLTYVRPMRGKIKVFGESKLISEHGVVGSSWYFSSSKFKMGLGLRYYLQQKGTNGQDWQDERNETVENENGDSIFLRGLYHEEPVLGGSLGMTFLNRRKIVIDTSYRWTRSYAIVPFIGGDVGDTWINRHQVQAAIGLKDSAYLVQAGVGVCQALAEWQGIEGVAEVESAQRQLFLNIRI